MFVGDDVRDFFWIRGSDRYNNGLWNALKKSTSNLNDVRFEFNYILKYVYDYIIILYLTYNSQFISFFLYLSKHTNLFCIVMCLQKLFSTEYNFHTTTKSCKCCG